MEQNGAPDSKSNRGSNSLESEISRNCILLTHLGGVSGKRFVALVGHFLDLGPSFVDDMQDAPPTLHTLD